MDSSEFIQKYLLHEPQQMQQAGVQLHLLSAMVHGIETAGALLDDKPFKAKGQGRKRFELALKKLFPKIYIETDLKSNLYNQLRSHMAHCMLPAKTILLTSTQYQHLSHNDGQWNVSIEVLFADYQKAMEKLLELVKGGKLKNKRIDFDTLFD